MAANKEELSVRFDRMCDEIEAVLMITKQALEDPVAPLPPGENVRQLEKLKAALEGLGENARKLLGIGLYRHRVLNQNEEESPAAMITAAAEVETFLPIIEASLLAACDMIARDRGSGGHNRLPLTDRIYIGHMADIYKMYFFTEPTTTANARDGFSHCVLDFVGFLELVSVAANPDEDFPYSVRALGHGIDLYREFFSAEPLQ